MTSTLGRNDKMTTALLVIQAHTYKNFEAVQTKALNLSKQCEVIGEAVENATWIVKLLENNVPQRLQVHFTALMRQSAVLQNEAQESMLGVMRRTQEMRGLIRGIQVLVPDLEIAEEIGSIEALENLERQRRRNL